MAQSLVRMCFPAGSVTARRPPSGSTRRRRWTMGAAVLVLVVLNLSLASAAHWDHAVFLDDDYRLLWSITGQDITFEVQARTKGYIGLGFSKDGTIYGADIVIGWVDQGQVHFQVNHSLAFPFP
ncbi:dopamine beta hydroxylase [Anopheles sinensis]|uniref:Dopamine beta hydroxylase n=1 Tax=Anopheles sinensis TaxID=74873 RepID=A0A084WGS0_ANOSI|nr:dopamine beta hydroxylase [Anopheles sinensis]